MDKKDHLDLLIHSLDHDLDEASSQVLTKALADSEELSAARDQLLTIRQNIGELTVAPSLLFVDSVMAALTETAEKVEAKIISLFPRVAAACIAFFILTFLMMALTDASFTTDALVGVQDLTPEDAYNLLDE